MAFDDIEMNSNSQQIGSDEGKDGDEMGSQDDPEIADYMKKYCEKSLNFFTVDNPVRKNCIRCIESPIFEGFILILIFTNTIQLGMIDYVYINFPERYKEVPWSNDFTEKT